MTKSEETPSEYLMHRFDAIKEFEETVSKLRGYPVGLVRTWYGRGDYSKINAGFGKALNACKALEAVIGEDDPYWVEGTDPFQNRGREPDVPFRVSD